MTYRIILLTFLSFCGLWQCAGQTEPIKKHSWDYEFDHEIYPGIAFGRSFNANAFKLSINLMDYAEITEHIRYFHSDSSFWYSADSYPLGDFLIPGISLNHHFSTNGSQKAVSQSVDWFTYIPIYKYNRTPWLALGVNFRHYDFKTYTISPHIKVAPPFLNLYFQRNCYYSGKRFYEVPKYEFGLELNLNSVVWLFNQDFGVPGGWAVKKHQEQNIVFSISSL